MSTTHTCLPRCTLCSVAVFALVLLTGSLQYWPLPFLRGQEAAPDEELVQQQKAVDRFLTVLEKNPRRGTALDRVYGFHVENGTLDALIKRFQDRAAKEPKDGTAWKILGLIESQRGRDAAAVEAFTKAESAAQPDAMSAYYRGQSLVLIGQPDEAVKAFEQAISRKPQPTDLLEIFQALGRVHQRAQRAQEALDVWSRLEKLFPNDVRVQEQIAGTLAEEGQTALALPRYEKLIQLTKDDYRKSVYRIQSAELKVKLNRSQEAIADLEKLLETLNPTNWLHRETRRKIEEVFLRTDDQDGLSKYYLAVVAKHPDDIDAMVRLSRLLARQGRVPEAETWLNTALKKAPNRKDLRQAFIDQLVDDQRFSDALVQYELLDKSDPNNPDLLRDWGKAILRDTSIPQAERSQRAEKIWRRLLDSKPNDPLIATQVADLFRHSEMPDAALELYKKAVTLAPDQPQYREYLGEYYHKLKRTDEALVTWRKITDGKQRNAANLARLAEVLASFGYLKEAIPEIQAACDLDSKNLELQVKAADLLTKAEQYTDALTALNRAQKLAENSDESELVLGAQLKVYELEDSLGWRTTKLIDEATQTAPTAPQWYLRARLHEAQRQYREASQSIDAALKLEPQSIPMLAAAARIFEQAGDLKSAVDLNRRLAVTDRRGRSDYLKYIAQLETQLGRIDEALKAGQDLIASAPGNTENYEFFANLCFRLGKTEDGLQMLRKAMRVSPNDPKTVLALAEALANEYRTDEAIELYWRAFDKSPNLDDKLSQIERLTGLYLQTNHLDKLLERIERIRREADDKRESTLCLAQAHSSAGDFGAARQELEGLLTDNTRDTHLLSQLSKLASSEGDLAGAVKFQQQLAKLAPGPETEYPLALLLSQTGAAQESAAITARLAGKESDAEKLLRSLDSLISAGQDETALLVIQAKLRERPKDWELLYREAVVLAKKDPGAASQRFRLILDFAQSDDEPGIALKNQLAKAARASSNPLAAAQTGMRLAVQPAYITRINALYQARYAAGLSGQDYYGRQGMWTPADFGQARMAAMAWLLRFARENKQDGEFLAGFQAPLKDSKAAPRQLWNAYYVAALNANDSSSYTEFPEVKSIIDRLAAVNDPAAEYLYLSRLYSRNLSAFSRRSLATSEVAPLTADEIALMLSSFNDLEKRDRAAGGATSRNYVYGVMVFNELKRAGRIQEAQDFYRTTVTTAQDLDDLVQAIAFSVASEDVPGTLALYDRWWNLARQDKGKITYIETPYAVAQLMGIAGAAKKDSECLKLLDYYLEHHEALANKNRSRISTGRGPALPGVTYETVYYYYGRQEFAQSGGYPASSVYFDSFAISTLRTAYEIFRRNDVVTDLQQHLARRLDKAADGNKIFGRLALAYISGWNDDKETALKEMVAASALAPQDWRLKLDVARLHIDVQNFDEALDLIETVAAVDQDSMRERESMALALAVRLGLHDRAQQAAERLFGLRLDAAKQMDLARQMRLLGMNDQAEAVMSRVQRQGGSQLSNLVTLMTAHQGQGKADLATQIAFQILRRSQPAPTQVSGARVIRSGSGNDSSSRSAALQVLRNAGKLKELITATEDQLKRAPQASQLITVLTELYDVSGDQKKSLALELTALEAKPDDVNLRHRYAQRLAASGDMNKACEQYKLVLKGQPSILRSDYYEISRVFEQANKLPELVQLLEQTDLKQLGHYSYLNNLVSNLLRTKEQQPFGIILLKKGWEAFPESRSDMIEQFSYNEQVWQIPEFYEFAKQSITPVATLVANHPWMGFGNANTVRNGGQLSNTIQRVLNGAAQANKLPELRAETEQQVAAFPTWKAGPVIIALIDLRLGQVEAARPLLEKLVDSKDVVEFPIVVRWIVGQELESREDLRPLVIKLFEGIVQAAEENPNLMPNRQFASSPGARLARLYVAAGRRDDARKLFSAAEKNPVPDYYDPNYAAAYRFSGLISLATEYESSDMPLDAARVYRQMLMDPNLSGPAVVQYAGDSDYFSRQVSSRWNDLISKLMLTPGLDLTDALLAPSAAPDRPVLDLMLSLQTDANGIPKIESQLAKLLTAQQVTSAATATMLNKAQELSVQHPDDLSVRIALAVLALSSRDSQRADTALSELRRLVEKSPLEMLPPGQRPNARQRDDALRQVGLWVVASECIKQEPLRSVGEILAARAVEAAERQANAQFAAAIHYDRAQRALEAKDSTAAEKHLSAVLAVALTRPKLSKPASGSHGSRVVGPGTPVKPVEAHPKSVPVMTVPPITLSQFRLAMAVADLAAEHEMLNVAARAMRESLAGGLPVEDPTNATESLGMTGSRRVLRPAAMAVASMADVSADGTVNTAVATRLLNLSNTWRAKRYPPAEIKSALADIVLPQSRPGEVLIYEQPINNWAEPRSLGRELAFWTVQLNQVNELRQQLAARQSNPSSALRANVLLVQLAVANNDDAAALMPLKQLAEIVKGQPRPDVAGTATHALALALTRPKLVADAIPLLEQNVKILESQRSAIADRSALALARHYLQHQKNPELRKILDSRLQAKLGQYARGNADYALRQQREDLFAILDVVGPSKELPLLFEYLGKLADLPLSRNSNELVIRPTPLWWVAWQTQALNPADRYTLLRDWTLPNENRRSLRYLSGYLRGEQLPQSFLTPDQASWGPPPARGLTSTFSLLVDAAKAAGKLDELQTAVTRAAEEKLPQADYLSILIALARGDATVNPKLKAKIEASQQRVAGWNPSQNYLIANPDALALDVEVASLAQANDFAGQSGRELSAQSMAEARKFMHSARVAHVARVVAEAGFHGLTPAEQEQMRLPNLKLWNLSSPPQRSPDNNPPAWWSAHAGLLTHVSGLANDTLFFRYPLTGTFDFAFEIHSGHYAEGPIGYGGLVSEPQYWNNGGQIFSVSRNEYIRRSMVPIAGDNWNRYSVRVTPESARFYCNGHLVYEESAPSFTSPWVAVHAQGTWRSTFRNFQLAGEPTIPRQVELIRDDRMEGWIAGTGEKLAQRLGMRERSRNQAADVRAPEDGRPIDWSAESGVLQGRRDPAAAEYTEGLLTYHRPLQNADRLRYEFLYEPGQTLVHPALDNLALMLEPTGVRLHGMTRGTIDGSRLEPGNAVDEPQNRRGPDALPLRPKAWNQVELSLSGNTVSVKLNSELVFERPMESWNNCQFGLFHYRDRTAAKVRNIVLSGNWPEKLSPQDRSDLLAPENPDESPALRRARRFIAQEGEIVDNAYQVVMKSREMKATERYDYLKEWVLPNAVHPTIRLQAAFTSVDPPVVVAAEAVSQLKGKRQHIGGQLVAPVMELMRTAKELNRLDALEQAINAGKSAVTETSRDYLSLQLLLALAREDDVAADKQLKALCESLRSLDPTTPIFERAAELTAIDAALERPALRSDIVALTEFFVNGNRQSGEWDYRLRSLRGKALWLNSDSTRDLPRAQNPTGLTQWAAVSHPTAEWRAKGLTPATWSVGKGYATFFTGNGDDALYFQSPLEGDFELRLKRTTYWWREIRPMYGNLGVELHWEGKSIWKCLRGRGNVAEFPQKIENWAPVVDYRLVVQNGHHTAYVNGKPVYNEKVGPNPDPWLSLQTSSPQYDGGVEDVQILGSPRVPEVLNLSSVSNLHSWRANYFNESIDAADAVWKKDKDEIVGALHANAPGSERQSLLQYHRPMLEDGEIEYDFYYDAGKTEVHPAIDRATFILTPTGIQLHYLTDAIYDRTGLSPGNMTPLPDSAKSLQLKDKAWNSLKLALAGDVVTLSLNGEKTGSYKLEAINQRIFGLFRYSSATASRIKNVTYRGNWPKQVPSVKLQELAAPK